MLKIGICGLLKEHMNNMLFCQVRQLQILWHSSHWEVGSLFPALGSGWALWLRYWQLAFPVWEGLHLQRTLWAAHLPWCENVSSPSEPMYRCFHQQPQLNSHVTARISCWPWERAIGSVLSSWTFPWLLPYWLQPWRTFCMWTIQLAQSTYRNMRNNENNLVLNH